MRSAHCILRLLVLSSPDEPTSEDDRRARSSSSPDGDLRDDEDEWPDEFESADWSDPRRSAFVPGSPSVVDAARSSFARFAMWARDGGGVDRDSADDVADESGSTDSVNDDEEEAAWRLADVSERGEPAEVLGRGF